MTEKNRKTRPSLPYGSKDYCNLIYYFLNIQQVLLFVKQNLPFLPWKEHLNLLITCFTLSPV